MSCYEKENLKLFLKPYAKLRFQDGGYQIAARVPGLTYVYRLQYGQRYPYKKVEYIKFQYIQRMLYLWRPFSQHSMGDISDT